MITVYLPSTDAVRDLLTAIEDIHPDGQVIVRDCIEIRTESAPIANFLKSLNINPNGKPAGDLFERTCKRCGKQFDPIRANQYTCSKCLADLAHARIAKNKNGQVPPAVVSLSAES